MGFRKQGFGIAWAMLLAVVGVGCASAPNYDAEFVPISMGAVQGTGLKISALDGSWVLTEGRFTPPFQTQNMSMVVGTPLLNDAPGYAQSEIGVVARQGLVGMAVTPSAPAAGNSSGALLESYPIALAVGAQRVIVEHPMSAKPLYGVLLLNKAHMYGTGAAARSYLIRVPEQYVREAQGGRVTVVFEPYSASHRPGTRYYGWVLWLSDSPI